MTEEKERAEALLPLFKTERLLNQDQDGRRVSLLGSISSLPALLVIERAPFPSSLSYLSGIPSSLSHLQNLGSNDVYRWYLGSLGLSSSSPPTTTTDAHADLKLNLFYPASAKHVKKYSAQAMRVVHETAAIYAKHVEPWISAQQAAFPERTRWIVEILEGRAEADDVIYRAPHPLTDTPIKSSASIGIKEADGCSDLGFVMLPDLNWDRRTASALHLLVLVSRRDVRSLRDLRKSDVAWLRGMRKEILRAVTTGNVFPGLDADQIKMYMHYQPTYYHFHLHVVHVAAEGGATQAVGKAIGLESIIDRLETMTGPADEVGMKDTAITYTIGEQSELWRDVWEPLRDADEVAA